MTVVDACILVRALADDDAPGDAARARLRDEELAAPELIDIEVLSAIRRQHAAGALDSRRAQEAIDDLTDLPIVRVPHRVLLTRCWELRDDLTVYDVAYIALAELLDVVLLTADTKLANAPGLRCKIEILR